MFSLETNLEIFKKFKIFLPTKNVFKITNYKLLSLVSIKSKTSKEDDDSKNYKVFHTKIAIRNGIK